MVKTALNIIKHTRLHTKTLLNLYINGRIIFLLHGKIRTFDKNIFFLSTDKNSDVLSTPSLLQVVPNEALFHNAFPLSFITKWIFVLIKLNTEYPRFASIPFVFIINLILWNSPVIWHSKCSAYKTGDNILWLYQTQTNTPNIIISVSLFSIMKFNSQSIYY